MQNSGMKSMVSEAFERPAGRMDRSGMIKGWQGLKMPALSSRGSISSYCGRNRMAEKKETLPSAGKL